jgi:hypothetical protein
MMISKWSRRHDGCPNGFIGREYPRPTDHLNFSKDNNKMILCYYLFDDIVLLFIWWYCVIIYLMILCYYLFDDIVLLFIIYLMILCYYLFDDIVLLFIWWYCVIIYSDHNQNGKYCIISLIFYNVKFIRICIWDRCWNMIWSIVLMNLILKSLSKCVL